MSTLQSSSDRGFRQRGGVAHGFQSIRQPDEIAPYNAHHVSRTVAPQHRGDIGTPCVNQTLQCCVKVIHRQGFLQITALYQLQQQLRLAPEGIGDKRAAAQNTRQLYFL